MPIGAAIGAASVVGGVATMSASNSAAKSSQKATDATVQNNKDTLAQQQAQLDNAINTAKDQYNSITPENIAALQSNVIDPINPLYKSAATALSDPTNNFAASPDYAYRVGQGVNAVNTDKAVNGLLKSGSALKAVTTFGQNTGAAEFNNWWQRQAGLLTGTGNLINSATGSQNNARTNQANAITNAATGTAGQAVSAIGNANSSTNDAIGANAVNQGNAAITGANSINSSLGSITDFLSKYNGSGTSSSYAPANTNTYLNNDGTRAAGVF